MKIIINLLPWDVFTLGLILSIIFMLIAIRFKNKRILGIFGTGISISLIACAVFIMHLHFDLKNIIAMLCVTWLIGMLVTNDIDRLKLASKRFKNDEHNHTNAK